MTKRLRFGFVSVVELGLSCMKVIAELGGRLDAVITLTDDRAIGKSGRVYLDDFAKLQGWPLHKIRHINDRDTLALLQLLELDWLFIIGWSQIASSEVLHLVRNGAIGMHPTLLPQGRGRASIPWAILRGLPETGVTAFELDQGVDTGPMLGRVAIPISDTETATSLYSKVNEAHRELMRKLWPQLTAGLQSAVPQDESVASYWPGRTDADGELRQGALSVTEVDRLVRATSRPYPGAFIREEGRVVRIWSGTPSRPGAAPAYVVNCSDGFYYATDIRFDPAQ